MQSGIAASQELLDTFNDFVSNPSQRALLASIQQERLVPGPVVSARSDDFTSDLQLLQSHISPTQAAYVLLRVDPKAADGFVAITFVPNAAPVRQKMLFASTRLTLVRELGIERFRSTLFATETEELTAQGWAKHEKHEALPAPMTTEEAELANAREVEARESGGTNNRRGHVNSKVNVPTGEGVLDALRNLKPGTLVQLKFQLPDETLLLDSVEENVRPDVLATSISAQEPRYSFYASPSSTEPQIVFIYTCPTGSRIKERMVYSTSKSWVRTVAERDAGVVVAKSLEATEPNELTAESFAEGETAEAAPSEARQSAGFSRPKRPGRR